MIGRRTSRAKIGVYCLFFSVFIMPLLPSARAQTDAKKVAAAPEIGQDAVVCVEVPHPEALIDRLMDP